MAVRGRRTHLPSHPWLRRASLGVAAIAGISCVDHSKVVAPTSAGTGLVATVRSSISVMTRDGIVDMSPITTVRRWTLDARGVLHSVAQSRESGPVRSLLRTDGTLPFRRSVSTGGASIDLTHAPSEADVRTYLASLGAGTRTYSVRQPGATSALTITSWHRETADSATAITAQLSHGIVVSFQRQALTQHDQLWIPAGSQTALFDSTGALLGDIVASQSAMHTASGRSSLRVSPTLASITARCERNIVRGGQAIGRIVLPSRLGAQAVIDDDGNDVDNAAGCGAYARLAARFTAIAGYHLGRAGGFHYLCNNGDPGFCPLAEQETQLADEATSQAADAIACWLNCLKGKVLPPQDNGPGGGGAGASNCETYYVEASNDDGATWTVVGSFTVCDDDGG